MDMLEAPGQTAPGGPSLHHWLAAHRLAQNPTMHVLAAGAYRAVAVEVVLPPPPPPAQA